MLPVTRTASSTLSRLGSYLRLAAQTPVVMCSVAAALAQPLLETLRIVKAVEPVERDADLRNKTILVTGATAGVGLATCKRLAARGARVLVCGRNAERTKRAVEEVGGRAEAVALDLCSLESVRACAEKVKPLKLDVVVLNAGVNANVPTAKHPELDCSLVFGVNFVAHYLLVTLLLDSLSADARVVCLASAPRRPCFIGERERLASMASNADASRRVASMASSSTPSMRRVTTTERATRWRQAPRRRRVTNRKRRRHAPPQRRVPRPRRRLRGIETGHGPAGAGLVTRRLR